MTKEDTQALDTQDLLPESALVPPGDLISVETVNAPTSGVRTLNCLVVASTNIPARASWRHHSVHVYLVMHRRAGAGAEYLLYERFILDGKFQTSVVSYFDFTTAADEFLSCHQYWEEA